MYLELMLLAQDLRIDRNISKKIKDYMSELSLISFAPLQQYYKVID
jgi:hypothetical protein